MTRLVDLTPAQVSSWLSSMAAIIPGTTLHLLGDKVVTDCINGLMFNDIVLNHKLIDLAGGNELSNFFANRIRKVWRQDFPGGEGLATGNRSIVEDHRPPTAQQDEFRHDFPMIQNPDYERAVTPQRNQLTEWPNHARGYGDRDGGMTPTRATRLPDTYPEQYGRQGGLQAGDVENMLYQHEEHVRREVKRMQAEQNKMQNAIGNLENMTGRNSNSLAEERLQRRCDQLEQSCASLELRAEQAEARLQTVLDQQVDQREHDANMIIDCICEVQRVDRRVVENAVADLFLRQSQNYASPQSGKPNVREERWNPRDFSRQEGFSSPNRPDYGSDYEPSLRRRPNGRDAQDRDPYEEMHDANRPLKGTRAQPTVVASSSTSYPRSYQKPNATRRDPNETQRFDDYQEENKRRSDSSREEPQRRPDTSVPDQIQRAPDARGGSTSSGAAPKTDVASSLPRVSKSPDQVADWVRGLPDTVLSEKVKEALVTKIEHKAITGDDFTSLIHARQLSKIGCDHPGHQSKIQKAWKSVLNEESTRQDVLKVMRETAKHEKRKAEKLIV